MDEAIRRTENDMREHQHPDPDQEFETIEDLIRNNKRLKLINKFVGDWPQPESFVDHLERTRRRFETAGPSRHHFRAVVSQYSANCHRDFSDYKSYESEDYDDYGSDEDEEEDEEEISDEDSDDDSYFFRRSPAKSKIKNKDELSKFLKKLTVPERWKLNRIACEHLETHFSDNIGRHLSSIERYYNEMKALDLEINTEMAKQMDIV